MLNVVLVLALGLVGVGVGIGVGWGHMCTYGSDQTGQGMAAAIRTPPSLRGACRLQTASTLHSALGTQPPLTWHPPRPPPTPPGPANLVPALPAPSHPPPCPKPPGQHLLRRRQRGVQDLPGLLELPRAGRLHLVHRGGGPNGRRRLHVRAGGRASGGCALSATPRGLPAAPPWLSAHDARAWVLRTPLPSPPPPTHTCTHIHAHTPPRRGGKKGCRGS